LFGNPHWYWRGVDRFYQAQLTIPGQINVSGASFLGVPVVLIGFNDNVAWSHTVSTANRFGFYQLTLAPGSSTSYMRDGKVVPMGTDTITVKVKQADGSVKPVTRTLYNSQYGPLVDLSGINPALGWGNGMAFAIRDINAGNFRSFRNWLRWDRAQSLDEFIAIQKQEAAIPWVNTTAVGKGSGQVWYADIGAVPNVSDAQVTSCTTPIGQMVGQVLPGVPFFDGSSSTCDWQSDPDSVQAGALGPSRMPSLMRSDYVANMNDSYWSTNPAALMTGYPAIMGPAGTQSLSMRTRMGHVLAQGRINGTDGYPGKGASQSSVQQMVLNSRVLTAELFKTQALPLVCAHSTISVAGDPDTGETFPAPVTVDVTQACTALAAWGNIGTVSARGAHVWDEFWRRAALLPESELYTVQFNPADPVHTPNTVAAGATNDLLTAFGAAVLRVQKSPYAENAVRGDYLFFTRSGRKLGLFGGCDQQGYFTIDCSDTRLDQGGYTMDNDPNGNSYMQVVSFPNTGVQAYTFLTFSLSDDPASPRYSNYSEHYATGSWLHLPFTEGEITSDAEFSSAVISE
jgi:acyl-homoserine-lactone acylase